jgi:3-dehydroquinate dehydratase/shikimate dehydrogenase
MTLLVTSIAADTLASIKAIAGQAFTEGAEAVELRIDNYLEDPTTLAEYLATEKHRTWIIACRSRAHGGQSEFDTTRRISLLVEAFRNPNTHIDLELNDWRGLPNILGRTELVPNASNEKVPPPERLILSTHNFESVPADPPALVDEIIAERRDAVAKLAYHGTDICDTFPALDLMHERRDRIIAIAMGEAGLWSRILAKKFGAFATYCCLDPDYATAPGQLTLRDMLDLYRWKNIDAATRVFGVIGDPIAHSMSPMVFNRWFADAGMNAIYLPLRVSRTGDCLHRFMTACMERPWLDLDGLSVTLPHKKSVLQLIGDGADHLARRIGAVNTLTFHNGEVRGYSTDCYASLTSLTDALSCNPDDLFGIPVDVLGTGGVAGAVLAWLNDYGCVPTIYGRSEENTRRLAEIFAARPAPWADRGKRTGEILINCTSVGMWPQVDASPMPPEGFRGCRIVFDLIYNPLKTRLLADATSAGAKTLNGLEMFIRQAAAQFELWTSKAPDLETAQELTTRAIDQQASTYP